MPLPSTFSISIGVIYPCRGASVQQMHWLVLVHMTAIDKVITRMKKPLCYTQIPCE